MDGLLLEKVRQRLNRDDSSITVSTVVYLVLYSYKTTYCCKVFVSIDKSKNKVLVFYLYLFDKAFELCFMVQDSIYLNLSSIMVKRDTTKMLISYL